MVTDRDIECFVRNGFLVKEDVLGPQEVDTINLEMQRFTRGEYAVSNADELPPASEEGGIGHQLLAVHFPHWVNSVFLEALRQPAIVSVLSQIVGAHLPGWDGSVKAMQSMVFMKPPGLPGQAWHQDEHFIPTRDRSLCGAWIALDDATVDNGCLWVVPGSHRSGMLYPTRHHHQPDRYDSAPEAYDPTDPGFVSFDHGAIPVPVRAGSVIFFNGHLLHSSQPNRTTDMNRRALVNHYCNAWSQLPWSVPGVESGSDYRVVVPVSGTDPYAWKGYGETPKSVYVRPLTMTAPAHSSDSSAPHLAGRGAVR